MTCKILRARTYRAWYLKKQLTWILTKIIPVGVLSSANSLFLQASQIFSREQSELPKGFFLQIDGWNLDRFQAEIALQ